MPRHGGMHRVSPEQEGALLIEHTGLELFDEIIAHEEKTRAPGTPQELAPSRCQHVTLQRLHVHLHHSHRLARIQEEGHAGFARDGTDGFGGNHAPPACAWPELRGQQ